MFEGVEGLVVEDVDADEGPVAEGLLGLLHESVGVVLRWCLESGAYCNGFDSVSEEVWVGWFFLCRRRLGSHVFDQVFHFFLRFELFPFCFDDAAVCIL